MDPTQCARCHLTTVKPYDPARYDVLLDSSGPYCSLCWPLTATGSQEGALSQ